ncbi:hypothetical protein BJ165DRAFT_1356506, partial [Panaeolus papilionaceus]
SRNVVRDNMIINPTGREGHFMPVDLNIEHHIGYCKEMFAGKGLHAPNWTRLGHISAAIKHLQNLKRGAYESIHTSYQGSTHTRAKTDDLVWKVADTSNELNLQKKVDNRGKNMKMTPNLQLVGYEKFEAGSLAAFNEKITGIKCGFTTVVETDEMEVVRLPLTLVEEDGTSTSIY